MNDLHWFVLKIILKTEENKRLSGFNTLMPCQVRVRAQTMYQAALFLSNQYYIDTCVIDYDNSYMELEDIDCTTKN